MQPDEDDGSSARAEAEALGAEIGAAPELRELVELLLELGISPEAIREAHARGRIEDAVFDPVLGPAREQRTVSAAEIEAGGGLRVAETQLVSLNFGLPMPQPDEPFFTPAEARALQRIGELREIWPPEVQLRVARVYGQALSAVAAAEVDAFRRQAESRVRSAGAGGYGALPAVGEALGELLPLADPLLLGVHRRRVEHELTQATVSEAEQHGATGALPGAVEVTLAFCDLKDFTAHAEARGDAAAVRTIERFAAGVTAELGEHGVVVKALGDGYMLSFPEPGQAVRACLRIIERMRGEDLGVHASVHHGVAVYRDGDFFGRTVNLAARLLDLAGRDELVACEPVVAATRNGIEWTGGELRRLRGLSEPVRVFATSPPAAQDAG
jgi:adenylate cyclase